MIIINYSISQKIPNSHKRRAENHQGLKLNLKWSEGKKIRDEIRKKHPGWNVEGYCLIKGRSDV